MISSGVNKQVVYSKETVAWGTAPAANTGKYLRRTTLELDLTRDSFESAEISSTAQTSDMRLGSDNVEGTLSGELSPGSYSDLFASLLRGTWAAVTTMTAITVASAATGNKLTRSTGSWITDGFKLGDLVNISGFTAPATANNTSAIITALTATDMSLDTSSVTLVTKAAGDSVTVATAGKKLIVPLLPASRTDESYTIEQFYNNINVSRLATGVKIGSASVTVAPNAMTTVEFGLMGKNVVSSGTAYFTTPAAASTSAIFSGNSGLLLVDNVPQAVVTGLNFEITGNAEAGVVIGQCNPAAIFLGRVGVTGEFTAYFENDTIFTKFYNETEISLVYKFVGDADDVMVIKFPKIKLGGSSVSDGETGGCIQTVPFTALLNDGTVSTIEASTIVIIDSKA